MKHLLTTLKEKWPEYLLEILVLVVGIYGAFALEEWGESSRERERTSGLMKALQTEHRNNQDQLLETYGMHQSVLSSAYRLLKSINEKQVLSDDTIKYHFVKMGYAFTYDPQNSTLESAISSGDIHLIKDDDLLNFLFAWKDQVGDIREEELRAKQYYTETIVPFSHQYIMETDLITSYFPEIETHSSRESDFQSMMSDRRFENCLATRVENISDILLELKPILEKNQTILSLLEASIKKIE